MDVGAVLEALNRALSLQHRSVLQYTLNAGSVFGLEYQAFGDKLSSFAAAELDGARELVEKITALGGEPSTEVPKLDWTDDSPAAVERMIELETEAVEAFQAVIPHTGHEGRSEALEHLMEHLILRKQNQIDFLLRAVREPRSSTTSG